MRVRIEQFLRGVVIAVLAVMLWQSLRGTGGSGARVIRGRGLGGNALPRWSALANPPGRIHVQLDSTPAPLERAWLGALVGAGTNVSWNGELAPVMIEARPIASPTGGTRLLVAAPSGNSIVLSDDIGPIDTVRPQSTGASIDLGSVSDRVTASAKGSLASTLRRDSLVLKKVLAIGTASWESKFMVAALEEDGWKVDAFIRVAPGVDVTQGPAAAIDTSRYSVVIALDSAASPYASRINEYVRNGGGLVLGPGAAALGAMAGLRAGNVADSSIAALRGDAIPLQKRSSAVTVAARRVGAGRIVQLGYADTWRWRMTGGDDGVRDHRKWWTGLVGSVASAGVLTREVAIKPTHRSGTSGDEAPFAGLVAAIGTSSPSIGSASFGKSADWRVLLFAVLAVALLAEIALRRARGAL
jgi:hypothetical protein